MKLKRSGWLFGCLLLLAGMQEVSAQTLKEVLTSSETPLVYLGVDFTVAKAIDAPENPMDMRDRHFPAINYLVVNEPKKYDLAGAFQRSSINHDLALVEKRNATINTENIKTSNTSDFSRLQEADIKNLLGQWDFGGKKGVGLLIVMEAMSKAQKGASMWVTLVDMESKKLLLTERMVGKTSIGFGFRNYWANPIREVIEDIEKSKYKEWKGKNGG